MERKILSIVITLFCCTMLLANSTANDSIRTEEDTLPINTFENDTIFNRTLKRGIVMRVWHNDIPMCIYAPPSYWSNEAEHTTFNILYLLSGTEDDDRGWLMNGGASDILDEMYQDEELEPMVVVMPLVDPNMNGEYEKNFYELMQFVETHLYAGKTKQRRAIAGLSIGGFHAMHIAHYYPNMFNYVGLFSAIYTPYKSEIFNKDVTQLFPSSEEVPEPYRHVEKDLKQQFKHAPKLYYIAIGKGDFLRRQNALFLQYMDEHGYPYRFHESDGGHEWKNWHDYLTLFLPKLFRNVDDTPTPDSKK